MKYNKAIINKVNNVTQVNFSKTEIKEAISSEDSKILKSEIIKWKNQSKSLNNQIEVTTAFLENKIKFIQDTDSLDKKIKSLLKENYFYGLDILPKTPLLELNKFSIPEPTTEQLKIIRERLTFKKFQPAPNDNIKWDEWENYGKPFFTQNDIDNITEQEVLGEYKKFTEFQYKQKAIKANEIDYITQLSDEQLTTHYQNLIENFKDELDYANKIVKALSEVIKNEYTNKSIPTYNGLASTILKSQKELFTSSYREASENDKVILKTIIIDFIKKNNDLDNATKIEIIRLIDTDNCETALDNYLMLPLIKEEKRILRTLRSIIYEMIQKGEVVLGKTICEVYITYEKFFFEYGITKDYKTAKLIKNVLFGFSAKGLHKEILLKHEKLINTSFILQIQEVLEKINISKKEVGIGFIVTMPSFLFVNQEKSKAKKYHNQYPETWKRFMSTGNMSQSNAAINIFHYIEFLIHNKSEMIINLSTLVEVAGDAKRYKKSSKEIQKKIEGILDFIIKAKGLISERITKVGKLGQIQYILKAAKHS